MNTQRPNAHLSVTVVAVSAEADRASSDRKRKLHSGLLCVSSHLQPVGGPPALSGQGYHRQTTQEPAASPIPTNAHKPHACVVASSGEMGDRSSFVNQRITRTVLDGLLRSRPHRFRTGVSVCISIVLDRSFARCLSSASCSLPHPRWRRRPQTSRRSTHAIERKGP